MMHQYTILDKNNNVIEINSYQNWATWHAKNSKTTMVGFNHLPNGVIVSTRFLELSKPQDKVFFETMVFGENFNNDDNQFPIRYKTYQEAILGHLEVISLLSKVE